MYAGLTVVLVGMLVGTASAAPVTGYDVAPWEIQADAGERIYVAGAQYTYALPDDAETPDEYTLRGMTWKYDGQASFTSSPLPHQPRSYWYTEQAEDQVLSDKLLGTLTVDRLGRRWVLTRLDEAAVRARLEALDRAALADFGPEPKGIPAPVSPEHELSEPVWVTDYPLSWTETACDYLHSIWRWNTDGRIPVSNPMTTQERKVVMVWGSSSGVCSGTMLDANSVLTAAHCLYDDAGDLYDPGDFTICTRGNVQAGAQCFEIIAWSLPPDWDSGLLRDDYAILHFSGDAGVGYMALSGAADSVLTEHDAYNVAYPQHAPGCVYNGTVDLDDTIGSLFIGFYGFRLNADHTHTPAGVVGTNLDIAHGHSGSPIFYYPSGCCGAHYITGVMSKHVSTFPFGAEYNGGPKARTIKEWVDANK